jgi:hypothetical protein
MHPTIRVDTGRKTWRRQGMDKGIAGEDEKMSPMVLSLSKTHRANHTRDLKVRSYANATSKEALNLKRAPTMINVVAAGYVLGCR